MARTKGSKNIVKRRPVVRRRPVQIPIPEYNPISSCASCDSLALVRDFLRAEVTRLGEEKRRLEDRLDKMMDKVVSFSEKASEQEHRMKMSQLSHMKPMPMEGMMNASSLMPDETELAVDQLMNEVMKGR